MSIIVNKGICPFVNKVIKYMNQFENKGKITKYNSYFNVKRSF